MNGGYAWSATTCCYENADAIVVQLVRENDGRKWFFSTSDQSDGYFNVENSEYGQPGCIIFAPADIEYDIDQKYSVTITGTKNGTLKYNVELFTTVPLQSFNWTGVIPPIEVNDTYYLDDYLETVPYNAMYNSSKVTFESSDTNVGTVDSNGCFTGKNPGKTTVTVRCGNVSASKEIEVVAAPQYDPGDPGSWDFPDDWGDDDWSDDQTPDSGNSSGSNDGGSESNDSGSGSYVDPGDWGDPESWYWNDNRVEQVLRLKVLKKNVKFRKLKKKAISVKAIKLIGYAGTVRYKKVSGSSRLKINKKNGKVTVKKSTKKGTYKIKVRVRASGNSYYKPESKTVTVKIRVK